MTRLVDLVGTSTFTYDALDRVTQESLPGGQTNTYSYDQNGNLASVTSPGGTIAYNYDAGNRLVTLTDPDSQQTTYSYDVNTLESQRIARQ